VEKKSAGLLLYRYHDGVPEVFLVHPGGPFGAYKDIGVWSIPKGEIGLEEEPLSAAMREFDEETGFKVDGRFITLTPVRQPGGKLVYAWALEGALDASSVRSNFFSMEWPPHSGRTGTFPEVDRAEFLNLEQAKARINPAQMALLEELLRKLGRSS
jgi:predicted NUDIX family NTP pyrophosphohydrolase